MPENPRKLPALGFAGFENSPAASGNPRRKRRWSLWPDTEAGAADEADAARFVTPEQLMKGLGRKVE